MDNGKFIRWNTLERTAKESSSKAYELGENLYNEVSFGEYYPEFTRDAHFDDLMEGTIIWFHKDDTDMEYMSAFLRVDEIDGEFFWSRGSAYSFKELYKPQIEIDRFGFVIDYSKMKIKKFLDEFVNDTYFIVRYPLNGKNRFVISQFLLKENQSSKSFKSISTREIVLFDDETQQWVNCHDSVCHLSFEYMMDSLNVNIIGPMNEHLFKMING